MLDLSIKDFDYLQVSIEDKTCNYHSYINGFLNSDHYMRSSYFLCYARGADINAISYLIGSVSHYRQNLVLVVDTDFLFTETAKKLASYETRVIIDCKNKTDCEMVDFIMNDYNLKPLGWIIGFVFFFYLDYEVFNPEIFNSPFS